MHTRVSNIRVFIGIIFCFLNFLTEISKANILGTDAQNFNTISNGLDFVTVQSSETLDPGVVNVGYFLNYAENTFSYLGGEGKNRDGMLGSDLNLGMGVVKNFDAGISMPYLITAWDKGSSDRVQLSKSGITEVRVNSKLRLWGNKYRGFALIGSINFGLIENNPYAGQGAGPTYNFEVAADTTLKKRIALGANLGYRVRTTGRKISDYPIDPLGDQFIASVAASYLLPKTSTKLITEIYGSWPASTVTHNTDRTQTTFEWIGGVKKDLSKSIALHGGAGTKLANGIASPDWRVYVGMNYVFGPIFGKPEPLIRKIPMNFQLGDPDPGEAVVPFWTEPTELRERFVASEILFGFNSDRIVNSGAKDALHEFAEHVKRPPRYTMVIIEGHTDSIGSSVYNADLSRRRAENIVQHLVSREGIDPKKIKAVGLGEDYPIADNGNYQGRAKNRRVEFKIYREGANFPQEYNPRGDR